jgi:tetratricopeptide (TPR) repeat protein
VQDDIAGEVVKALKVKLLGGTENRPTAQADIRNGASYDAYLKGLFYFNKSGDENLAKATDYMQEAVDLAPQSALAWAGLSRALSGYAGQTESDPTDLLVRAREAVNKALALDANLADAHLAMADLKSQWDWDWGGAEAAANHVLALRPGDLDAQMILVDLHVAFDRLDEAEHMVRAVLAKDPLNTRHPRMLVRILYYLQRYDEALQIAESLLERDSHMPYVRSWMAAISNKQGRSTAALQFAQSEPVLFARLTSLAMTHDALGNSEEAEAARQQLEDSYGVHASAQQAVIFASWGELDTAIDWLEIAVANHDPGIVDIKSDKTLAVLRGHPRYEALLRKMNLAD